MNTLLVFLIILILLIVIAILIDKSGLFKSPEALTTNKGLTIEKQQANLPSNVNLPSPTWSKPEPYGSTGTNTCNIYTFIAGDFTPAVASYSKLNSGGRDYLIENIDPNFICIDSDQIFSQTIKHSCINAFGDSAGAGCILTVDTPPYKAGDFVPNGFVEGEVNPLYTPCVPANLNNNKGNSSYCIGNIGLVIPNFEIQKAPNTDPSPNQCLAGLWYQGLTGTGIYNTGLETCNLSQSTQIFRTVRYTVDSSGNLTQDDKGPVAAIIHRYTGFYLAPKLPQIPYNISGNTGFYYDFKDPIYNYDLVEDNFGNKSYGSIDLVLINPAYDPGRQGVYWLLQNQTFNPSINTQTTNFNSFANLGIYYNQSDFTTQFTPKNVTNANTLPTVNSYFFEQTVNYCNDNPGATNCSSNVPLTINDDDTVSSCYFGTNPTSFGSPGTGKVITNIPVGMSPQQIVYIPDLTLLPDPNSSSIWTYLVNNYSINIVNNKPILTPFRQSSSIDLRYDCVYDDNNSNNVFTRLVRYSDSQQYITDTININSLSNGVASDTQFINYSSFARQIQMGVSTNYHGLNNTNFKNVSNPFN